MDIVADARELFRQGRFVQAANRLASLSSSRVDAATTLLKAQLHEITGDLTNASARGQNRCSNDPKYLLRRYRPIEWPHAAHVK